MPSLASADPLLSTPIPLRKDVKAVEFIYSGPNLRRYSPVTTKASTICALFVGWSNWSIVVSCVVSPLASLSFFNQKS